MKLKVNMLMKIDLLSIKRHHLGESVIKDKHLTCEGKATNLWLILLLQNLLNKNKNL